MSLPDSGERMKLSGVWLEMRELEYEAVLRAPEGWLEFVKQCERVLGRPWAEIVSRFNEHDRITTRAACGALPPSVSVSEEDA